MTRLAMKASNKGSRSRLSSVAIKMDRKVKPIILLLKYSNSKCERFVGPQPDRHLYSRNVIVE